MPQPQGPGEHCCGEGSWVHITIAEPPMSSFGGRESAGATQPRLEGNKVKMVEMQGEPRERVQLRHRPQAWGWTEIEVK